MVSDESRLREARKQIRIVLEGEDESDSRLEEVAGLLDDTLTDQ